MSSYVKVIKSCPCTGLDRPLGLQKVQAARIHRRSAQEDGKIVRHTHTQRLPLGVTPGIRFC